MLVNAKNEVQYALRKRWFGKLKIRLGLPKPKRIPGELKYYALLCERALLISKKTQFDWIIDVGCRNWSYNSALAQIFPEANLIGIEADGYRRYFNLHRRMDAANSYSADLRKKGKKVLFLPENFLDLKPEALGITPGSKILFIFFFPFVSDRPCLKWGLPTRFNAFQAQLEKASVLSKILNSPFQLISAHQGYWEATSALDVFNEFKINVKTTQLKSQEFQEFWPSSIATHIFSGEL